MPLYPLKIYPKSKVFATVCKYLSISSISYFCSIYLTYDSTSVMLFFVESKLLFSQKQLFYFYIYKLFLVFKVYIICYLTYKQRNSLLLSHFKNKIIDVYGNGWYYIYKQRNLSNIIEKNIYKVYREEKRK